MIKIKENEHILYGHVQRLQINYIIKHLEIIRVKNERSRRPKETKVNEIKSDLKLE